MSVTTIESVKKSVTVNASPERAFEVFTARFGDWWPLASHHTAEDAAATAIIEPHVGGRWFECGVSGTETMWGYVTSWEPPTRLVLAWHLSADFHFDPDNASEVEVRFVAEPDGRTRVELEHRNLDVYGDRAAELRTAISSDGGWGAILEEFAKIAG
jgi:uncharacterized protein YndB with AHSA1/START domain